MNKTFIILRYYYSYSETHVNLWHFVHDLSYFCTSTFIKPPIVQNLNSFLSLLFSNLKYLTNIITFYRSPQPIHLSWFYISQKLRSHCLRLQNFVRTHMCVYVPLFVHNSYKPAVHCIFSTRKTWSVFI